MKDADKSREQIVSELVKLRQEIRALSAHESGRLEQGQEKLRLLLQRSPTFTMTVNRDGTIQIVNHIAKGVTAEEFIGKQVYDYIIPESRDKHRQILAEVFRSGEVRRLEISTGVGPEGVAGWYETIFMPISDGERVVSAMLLTTDISEQKRTREELNRIFTLSFDLIGMADLDGYFKRLNPAFCEMLGHTEEELLSKPFTEFIHPEDRNITFAEMRKLGVGKRTVQFENRYKAKNGSYRIIEWNAAPFQKANLVYAIGRDITERKRIEEALRKERDFCGNLIETAQTIVLVLDTNGKIVTFNPYMERLSGYSLSEVKGKDWFTTFLPECDYNRIRELFKQAVGDMQTRGNVNPIITKGGEQRYIEWHDKTLKDSSGNAVGLLAIGQDITERKKVEDKLRLHSEIMKNMAEGVYLVGADDGIIKYCNPRFEKIFGYESGEMIGKHVTIVNAPCEKDPEEIAEEIMVILNETGEWHGEVNNIRKNGTSFWCYARCSIFHHPQHGRVIVAVHADITERKEAQEAQAKLVAELQQSLADIKTLEGMIDICMTCKKIRDANGEWQQMESYITAHSKATFSHGYCPECGGEWLKKCREAERTLEDRYF